MLPADIIPLTLDQLARRGASGAPALAGRFGTLDYAALDALTSHVAGGLLARGLQPGDRVATWLAKTRLACVMPLATARAGLIHVPINPLLKHAQAAHIIADSGARLLIAGEGRAATLAPGDLPDDAALLLEAEADDVLPGCETPLPPSDGDPQRLAAILYTSGSTGRPKGVMLSHANLWLGALSVASYLKLSPADRTLCVLPLSFDYGQNQLLSTWAAGGCAIPLDYLTPRDVIRAVDSHDATTLAGVPPLWIQLVEADWPPDIAGKLKRLTNSGGALGTSLVRRLRDRFPAADLYPMYGLTEAFRSTYLDPGLVDSHPESMGRAIPLAEILVVRPDGLEAGDGEAGELVHAGPLVARGYWNDSERTAERFRPAPSWSRAGGMAVWSGDTVMRDADGLHYFVGRDDEMIKSSGNRISPAEIEEAAAASGAVAESMALGMPDARLGHAIHVVARAAKKLKVEAAEVRLRAWLKAELPGFMQPHVIHWRDALPRNANGKLDRAGIRAELMS